jgi:HKD family nuclease
MSTIDLQRLRAIQSYFVPIKKEKLAERIFNELDAMLPTLSGLKAWRMEEHGNSLHFAVNFEYAYVISKLAWDEANLDKNVQKLRAEYSKLHGSQGIKESLTIVRFGQPFDVYVNIRRCEANGCEIEVECTPALYRRVSQLYEKNFDDCQIQEAHISCERFLRTVFIGGLSGTLLFEKSTSQGDSTEFLTNDVSKRQITEKLEKMLDNATGEILVFGWIGTIFLNKLQELKKKGVKIRFITGNTKTIRQDEMRREKEKAMREIISIVGKANISSKPEFHGRAVIADNKALVGSMDLDSYSMTGARIEFAMYTENPEIVRTLRSYFEQVFSPLKEEVEDKERTVHKQKQLNSRNGDTCN